MYVYNLSKKQFTNIITCYPFIYSCFSCFSYIIAIIIKIYKIPKTGIVTRRLHTIKFLDVLIAISNQSSESTPIVSELGNDLNVSFINHGTIVPIDIRESSGTLRRYKAIIGLSRRDATWITSDIDFPNHSKPQTSLESSSKGLSTKYTELRLGPHPC